MRYPSLAAILRSLRPPLSLLTLLYLLTPAPAAAQELADDRCNVLEDQTLDKGLGEASRQYIWRDGIVPYRLNFGKNTEEVELRQVMERSIEILNATTNVCFVPYKGSDPGYINIIKSERDYNYAYIGYGSGPRELGMLSTKVYIGLHELLHSLGVHHEQKRPDRDEYVRVIFENIEYGLEHNFFEVDTLRNPYSYTGPYDFNSVMHYGPFAFSRNGFPTITRVDGQELVRNVEGLSALDVVQLNAMYPEPVLDCAKRIEDRTVRYTVAPPVPGEQGFCTGQELTFSAASSRPDRQTTYKWTAAKATPSTGFGPNFTAQFDKPGRHVVSVAMTTDGVTEQQDVRVRVTEFNRTLLTMGNPVPAGGELLFRVRTSRPAYEYALYDALGRAVTPPIPANNAACGTRHQLPAPAAPGTYYLRVAGDGVGETTPIVVH